MKHINVNPANDLINCRFSSPEMSDWNQLTFTSSESLLFCQC